MLFHVLGPIEVHAAAVHPLGAGKPAAVLAALLLEPNAWVTVDRLVESGWPEQDAPASAVANLKTYVWQLRRLLPDGGGRIERRADAYRLRVGPGELDADLAAALHTRALRVAADGEPAAAVAGVQQALGLWRGRPYSGVETPDSAIAVARLDELRLDLREHLAELLLTLGRPAAAETVLRSVTAEAPLRESAWATLVSALHAAGRRTAALAAHREAAAVLAAELGVEPGPALAAAHRLVRGATRPVAARRELPRDVEVVGRAPHLAALRRHRPVVLLSGMPGSGTTALAVHAAHLAAPDHPDGQLFVHLRGSDPGGPLHPAAALERLLRCLDVAAPDVPADGDERAALWRSLLAGRRLLIVLDDAVDADQVTPLLPAGDTCRTVVTTANRGWHLPGATRIAVQPLDEKAAAALFAAAAGVPPADAAVAAVVRHCGGLPVALLDAAARLRSRPQWTVRRLVAELDEDPCRVLTGACRRLGRPGSRTWRALGRLPATFDAAAAARATGVPAVAARVALEALVDEGLLDAVSPEVYRSHPLVRHLAACGGAQVRSLPDRRAA